MINSISTKSIALFFLGTSFFVSTISVSCTTITYIAAFFFLLLSFDWRKGLQQIKSNSAAMSFLVLCLLYVIGIFYSTSTTHFILKDLHKNHWLLMTPFFIVFISDARWRHYMINAFLCAMIITVFLSYIKFFHHIDLLSKMHFLKLKPREGGDVFSDHIVQSFAMSIAAFICGCRFLFEKKYRVFYLILFLLMGVNIIFMSKGRTGYGIFLLLLCYLGLIRFGWRGMLVTAFAGILLLSAAFVFSSSFQTRTRDIYWHYKNFNHIHRLTSVGQRVEMLHIAEKMFVQRPWFGYGTGGIRTALPKVVAPQDRIYNPSIDYVESIYLNFLLEFGIVGLVVFLCAMLMQIRETFYLRAEYRYLMQAVLIATLFGGFFNAFFDSFPIAHIYALFAAACFGSGGMNDV